MCVCAVYVCARHCVRVRATQISRKLVQEKILIQKRFPGAGAARRCVCRPACTHARTHKHKYTNTHTLTHTRARAHTHTDAHTHSDIHKQESSQGALQAPTTTTGEGYGNAGMHSETVCE